MNNPRLSKAAGVFSLLGFISLILMISLFSSSLALFQLETHDESDFEEGPKGDYNLIIETEGPRMLYVIFESTEGPLKDFKLTIEGPDGENVFEGNLSTPYSDIIGLDEGGKYQITINMTRGSFEDMSITISNVGYGLILLFIGSFLLLPISTIFLLTGMIMGIIALHGLIRRNNRSRDHYRPTRWGEMR